MARITLNEPGIRALTAPGGVVARMVEEKAKRVEERARVNAAGPVIDIDSGDLLRGLKTTERQNADGVFFVVGTDAEHRGFRYPGYHDENGRPWLTEALADEFP